MPPGFVPGNFSTGLGSRYSQTVLTFSLEDELLQVIFLHDIGTTVDERTSLSIECELWVVRGGGPLGHPDEPTVASVRLLASLPILKYSYVRLKRNRFMGALSNFGRCSINYVGFYKGI
jgi:hypothetical protein